MAPSNICPAPEELVHMLLGELTVERSAEIEQHLNWCAPCLLAVEELHVDSQVLHELKKQPIGQPTVQADLQKLMTRLVGLHAATDSGSRGGPTVPASNEFPVLGRAETAGELGRLGHFRVLELLGAGGMGVVYRGEDTRLQRSVALKVLRPRAARDPDARARFLREARAVASIKHDHVVVVHEVGEAVTAEGKETTPFLAMELLEGESLDAWMSVQRRPPLAWGVRLGRQIAEALAALHARGLIHRDVKPANLWLESSGAKDDSIADSLPASRVKLLDFGLAFTVSDTLAEARAPGTPAYMAPEQLAGAALDGRCDLFSLGCVLYELCTGEYPFPDRKFSAVHTAPFPVSDVNPAVPAELSHLIDRMLDKDREGRPESAHDVVRELAAIEKMLAGSAAHETVRQLDTAPAIPRAPALPTRRRRFVLAVAVGLTALAAVLGWFVAIPLLTRPEPRLIDPIEIWCETLQQFPPKQQFSMVGKKLEELNPGYDRTKATGWVEPELVIRFNEKTDHISDIRPFRCLTDLKTLVLVGTAPGLGKISSLAPLKGLRLTKLVVAQIPEVRDLAPIKGMPLKLLNVSDTAVSSLADIADAPLETLDIARTPITDLSPLRKMSKLTAFDCRGCPIVSLEPLAGTAVKELDLDFRPERDAALLKQLTTLQTINGLPVKEFWRRQAAE